MKNIVLILGFIFGLNTYSVKASERNGNALMVFVEQGIEFVVYPNGQFSYAPIHTNYGASVNISTRNGSTINIATNQRNQMFVDYDRYGRIARVNNVLIAYHRDNRVSQIGSAYIDYRVHNTWVAPVSHCDHHHHCDHKPKPHKGRGPKHYRH
jgi:hypothetical protein